MTRQWRNIVCVLGLLGVISPAGAESLLEVYNRALTGDPLIREAEANLLASREAKPQALAALLPQISGFAQGAQGDAQGSSIFQNIVPDGMGGVTVSTFSSSFEQDNNEDQFWQLTVRQTVFRWDQWLGLGRADKEVAQAEADYQFAQQDLMVRVADAYFNVLAAQDTLDAEIANNESTKRQLDQAQKRFEVGLIAITDVLEAQAVYDLSVATDINARRFVRTSKERLREITGIYIDDLVTPGDDLPLVSPSPEDPDSWVELAMDQNLSVISSRLGADIAREEVKIARTGHYPTLDFVADRQDFSRDADRSDLGNPKGIADSQQKTNQLRLELSIPIYSGGRVNSQTRQRVYQHRAAKERLERVTRETVRSTRDSYDAVISQIARVRALLRAVESNETALEATEAGFEVGTRTTVDVLDARQLLFRARTDYARTRYDYIVNVLRLKQAAGTLTADDVTMVDSWLK